MEVEEKGDADKSREDLGKEFPGGDWSVSGKLRSLGRGSLKPCHEIWRLVGRDLWQTSEYNFIRVVKAGERI